MGIRGRMGRVKALEEAAASAAIRPSRLRDLNAEELLTIAYVFHRFKHLEAATQAASEVDRRMADDGSDAEELRARAAADQARKSSDWKMLESPTGQSAVAKLNA